VEFIIHHFPAVRLQYVVSVVKNVVVMGGMLHILMMIIVMARVFVAALPLARSLVFFLRMFNVVVLWSTGVLLVVLLLVEQNVFLG
jgi:hypothetical protein